MEVRQHSRGSLAWATDGTLAAAGAVPSAVPSAV